MVCFKRNIFCPKMTLESLVIVCFTLLVSFIFLSNNAFASGDVDSFSGKGDEQKQKQLKDAPSQKMPSSNQNVLYGNGSKPTSSSSFSSSSSSSETGTEPKNM